MKLKVSKSQWEEIGKVGGWLKEAQTQMTQTMPLDGVQNAEDSKADFKQVAKKEEVKEAKKEKSPKEHGFIDQCIEKNKDKANPGAYCASIVDKVKGTTDWRKKD